MSDGGQLAKITADNPIRYCNQDLLERKGAAKAFARDVLALDTSEGVAVGVFGPWGSGKTSFINLAGTYFNDKKIPVIEFNPWLFSGTEQLVGQFFAELSTELRAQNLAELGKALEDYGDAFTGGHSHVRNIGVILKVIGKYLRRRHKGVIGYRDTIKEVLSKRNQPIIVVLDDVDRLSVTEKGLSPWLRERMMLRAFPLLEGPDKARAAL